LTILRKKYPSKIKCNDYEAVNIQAENNNSVIWQQRKQKLQKQFYCKMVFLILRRTYKRVIHFSSKIKKVYYTKTKILSWMFFWKIVFNSSVSEYSAFIAVWFTVYTKQQMLKFDQNLFFFLKIDQTLPLENPLTEESVHNKK
jgi:fatty acid desaturase